MIRMTLIPLLQLAGSALVDVIAIMATAAALEYVIDEISDVCKDEWEKKLQSSNSNEKQLGGTRPGKEEDIITAETHQQRQQQEEEERVQESRNCFIELCGTEFVFSSSTSYAKHQEDRVSLSVRVVPFSSSDSGSTMLDEQSTTTPSASPPSQVVKPAVVPHLVVFDLDHTILSDTIASIVLKEHTQQPPPPAVASCTCRYDNNRNGGGCTCGDAKSTPIKKKGTRGEHSDVFVDGPFFAAFCEAAHHVGHVLGIASYAAVTLTSDCSTCTDVIGVLDRVLPFQRSYLNNALQVVCHPKPRIHAVRKRGHIDRIIQNHTELAANNNNHNIMRSLNTFDGDEVDTTGSRSSSTGMSQTRVPQREQLSSAQMVSSLENSPMKKQHTYVVNEEGHAMATAASSEPWCLNDGIMSPPSTTSTPTPSAAVTVTAAVPVNPTYTEAHASNVCSPQTPLEVEYTHLPVVLIDDDQLNCLETEGVAGYHCPKGFSRQWYRRAQRLQSALGIRYADVAAIMGETYTAEDQRRDEEEACDNADGMEGTGTGSETQMSIFSPFNQRSNSSMSPSNSFVKSGSMALEPYSPTTTIGCSSGGESVTTTSAKMRSGGGSNPRSSTPTASTCYMTPVRSPAQVRIKDPMICLATIERTTVPSPSLHQGSGI